MSAVDSAALDGLGELKARPQRLTATPRPEALRLKAIEAHVVLTAFAALLAARLAAMVIFPFTDTTEARYAEIARKMVETGDWITPQFDYGVPFWGKPPLHTWMSAAGMQLFGVGEFGARIFTFAASLGLLLVVYRWLARQRGTNFALVAVTVLMSGGLFFGSTGFVSTDMAMTVGTTLSMIGFWSAVSRKNASEAWGYLIFVGAAIGLLAKGPVALALTAIPIAGWMLIGNRWRLLLRIPWARGLALMFVLAAPWYLTAELKTPGFLRYFLVGEHIERFLVPGWDGDLYGRGHARPKGMIWLFWLATFLPWTLFLPAFVKRFQLVRGAFRGERSGWRSYLLLWTVSPLILFTPAANILPAYTLPGLPAAAILLTQLWVDVWGARPGPLARRAFLAAVAGVVLFFFAVSAIVVLAPANPYLKSLRQVVATVDALAPGAQLYTFGQRVYSGEFYTAGSAKPVPSLQDLDALTANGTRDAVAIRSEAEPALPERFKQRFEPVGKINRYFLFVERANLGRQ